MINALKYWVEEANIDGYKNAILRLWCRQILEKSARKLDK